MNYFDNFQISASGLMAEKLRLEAVSLNLANANSTFAPGTTPYQSLRVVSRPIAGSAFTRLFEGGRGQLPAGVTALSLEKNTSEPHMVFDPQHPDADAKGFVAHANVDPLSEMVSMMSAVRAYEANIKAISAAKTMAQKALEIGNSK